MKLSSRKVYLLTNPSGNYMPVPQIAIAPKYFTLDSVGYLNAGGGSIGHAIHFDEVDTSEAGVLVMRDSERMGDDGLPVDWRWEWLSYELWEEIGPEHVVEFEEAHKQLTDTWTMQVFYLANFVEDWWLETPSVGE